jgi:hypothetical protein
MFTTSVINKNAYVFIYSTVITHQYFFIYEAHTFLVSKSSQITFVLSTHYSSISIPITHKFCGWSREVYIDVFFNNSHFPLFSVCVLFKMYHITVGCSIVLFFQWQFFNCKSDSEYYYIYAYYAFCILVQVKFSSGALYVSSFEVQHRHVVTNYS